MRNEKEFIGIQKVKAFYEKHEANDGYTVIYADGYQDWIEKEIFEKSFFEVGNNNVNKIYESVVDKFIAKYEDSKFDEKTTMVKATLVNGFTILVHSSCVSAENYNHALGIEFCKKKIKNRVWGFLGFALQTAINGVNNR